MVTRKRKGSRVADAYLLQNVKQHAYIVGCSETKREDYMFLMRELADEIRKKNVLTPTAARRWLADRVIR